MLVKRRCASLKLLKRLTYKHIQSLPRTLSYTRTCARSLAHYTHKRRKTTALWENKLFNLKRSSQLHNSKTSQEKKLKKEKRCVLINSSQKCSNWTFVGQLLLVFSFFYIFFFFFFGQSFYRVCSVRIVCDLPWCMHYIIITFTRLWPWW